MVLRAVQHEVTMNPLYTASRTTFFVAYEDTYATTEDGKYSYSVLTNVSLIDRGILTVHIYCKLMAKEKAVWCLPLKLFDPVVSI